MRSFSATSSVTARLTSTSRDKDGSSFGSGNTRTRRRPLTASSWLCGDDELEAWPAQLCRSLAIVIYRGQCRHSRRGRGSRSRGTAEGARCRRGIDVGGCFVRTSRSHVVCQPSVSEPNPPGSLWRSRLPEWTGASNSSELCLSEHRRSTSGRREDRSRPSIAPYVDPRRASAPRQEHKDG
jgi:hypothetical protein